MATTLADLDEYFAPGLTLTVLGKKYVVPLPSAELGLWCQRVAQAGGAIHAAATPAEAQAAIDRVNALPELDGDLTLAQRVLGAVYEQLAADKVPHPYIEYCGATAYVWIIAGEEAAERYWTSGGRPEALSPTPANRAERRAAGKTSTAAAATTRTPVSSSGTKSPRKSAKSTTARRATRSRGSSS